MLSRKLHQVTVTNLSIQYNARLKDGDIDAANDVTIQVLEEINEILQRSDKNGAPIHHFKPQVVFTTIANSQIEIGKEVNEDIVVLMHLASSLHLEEGDLDEAVMDAAENLDEEDAVEAACQKRRILPAKIVAALEDAIDSNASSLNAQVEFLYGKLGFFTTKRILEHTEKKQPTEDENVHEIPRDPYNETW